jgi:hypothetical protein
MVKDHKKFIVYVLTHVIVHHAIVPVAFGLTNVHDGSQALSVSILTSKLGLGIQVFHNFNVIEEPATQEPKALQETLVFPAISHIFCAVVLSEAVGYSSRNTACLGNKSSPAITGKEVRFAHPSVHGHPHPLATVSKLSHH